MAQRGSTIKIQWAVHAKYVVGYLSFSTRRGVHDKGTFPCLKSLHLHLQQEGH